MASTTDDSTSAQNGLTPAQRLQQEHESHNPTIEDVPDEEDIAHPPPSATVAPASSNTETASSVNGGTMSAKAQGKQKAADEPVNEVNGEDTKKKAPALDTASEEAFPSLGPAKAKPMASTWGSRPAAARTNGTTPNNTGFGGPTPMTMPNRTAASMAQRPAQGVSIPGRYVEDMRMPSDQLRTDLKRPIADLLKDINRKSKAKVDMRRGNGTMIFQGQGPSIDSVHEILREVAAQLGQKVSIDRNGRKKPYTNNHSNKSRCKFPRLSALSSSASKVLQSRVYPRELARAYRCQKLRLDQRTTRTL